MTVGMLFGVAWMMTHSFIVAIVAGITYTMAYPAWGECRNLNSRPLGNLLLSAMLLALFGYVNSGWLPCLIASGILGIAVVMTHKMTTQYMVLGLIALTLIFWTPLYALVLVVVLGVCYVMFPMFVKMLRSQWDILLFWGRNWRNLGAHQVYSSPIYGNEGRYDNGRVFGEGWLGFMKNGRYMGMNAFAVMLIFPLMNYGGLGLLERQMLWWSLTVYILAGITLFIPWLRFYGEGYKYLRMTALPVAYLAGCSLISGVFDGWQVGLYSVAVLGAVFLIWRGFRYDSKTLSPETDGDFGKILEYLKRDEVKVVLSVPTHLMDAIVYHCRKPVVWGGHSDNFRALEPMFPVFREPLEWFVHKYGVTHMVINRAYCLPFDIGIGDDSIVCSVGDLSVCEVGLDK